MEFFTREGKIITVCYGEVFHSRLIRLKFQNNL